MLWLKTGMSQIVISAYFDIYGLIPATMNDASILTSIMSNNSDLKSLLVENDLMIFDRGF